MAHAVSGSFVMQNSENVAIEATFKGHFKRVERATSLLHEIHWSVLVAWGDRVEEMRGWANNRDIEGETPENEAKVMIEASIRDACTGQWLNRSTL